jgi:hypothetical protein
MQKRVYIALAVLLVMLAGVIAWQVLHLREPIYQGKRLSSWLEAYKLYGVAGVETWQVRVEQQEADEAVRRIGTNALPTLLRMLRAKDSALKVKLMDLAQKQRFIHINYIPSDELNYRACSAFGVLRAKAQSAVPALIRIYEQNISPCAWRIRKNERSKRVPGGFSCAVGSELATYQRTAAAFAAQFVRTNRPRKGEIRNGIPTRG